MHVWSYCNRHTRNSTTTTTTTTTMMMMMMMMMMTMTMMSVLCYRLVAIRFQLDDVSGFCEVSVGARCTEGDVSGSMEFI